MRKFIRSTYLDKMPHWLWGFLCSGQSLHTSWLSIAFGALIDRLGLSQRQLVTGLHLQIQHQIRDAQSGEANLHSTN